MAFQQTRRIGPALIHRDTQHFLFAFTAHKERIERLAQTRHAINRVQIGLKEIRTRPHFRENDKRRKGIGRHSLLYQIGAATPRCRSTQRISGREIPHQDRAASPDCAGFAGIGQTRQVCHPRSFGQPAG